jgi:hypothetical protein
MIDPATIARMIATTALAFGISGSTATEPEVRLQASSCPMIQGENGHDIDDETGRDWVDPGVIPALPRPRAGALWI